MIVVTAGACAAALIWRAPLRSRYWAARVIDSDDMAERALYLSALCNAGDAGRWGTSRLLKNPDEAVRAAGVIVLQNVRSDWSRRRLIEMLSDPSRNVRELAALGLAIHGDDSAIPRLREMFATTDESSVGAACVALERLATPRAVATLAQLAAAGGTVMQRAHLVDALAGIGSADCIAPLVRLLDDHRDCKIPTRSDQLAIDALSGASGAPDLLPFATTRPVESGARTIAERAAAALTRITGLSPPFASGLPQVVREEAARIWLSWNAEHHP